MAHYSTTLALRAEYVQRNAQSRSGFLVPDAATLLALKIGAWIDRRGTPKGDKDLLDIKSLLPLVPRGEFFATLLRAGLEELRRHNLQQAYDQLSQQLLTKKQRRQARESEGPQR